MAKMALGMLNAERGESGWAALQNRRIGVEQACEKKVAVKVFLPLQELYAWADLEKAQPAKSQKNLSKNVIESAAQPQKSVAQPRRSSSSLLYTQQIMSGTSDNYRMALPPFTSWVQQQQIKTPEADRILPLIAAHPQGISRGVLGKATTLDREVLDDFLDGLVRVGVVRVDLVDGVRVYRTANPTIIGR